MIWGKKKADTWRKKFLDIVWFVNIIQLNYHGLKFRSVYVK